MLRLLCALLLLLTIPAFGHDADDPYGDWYKGLRVPGTGNDFGGGTRSCCNGSHEPDADCKNVQTRIAKGPDGKLRLEAWADDKTFPASETSPFYGHTPNDWVAVPDDVILHGKDNPTGAPVGCWFSGRWRCFVESSQI